VRAYREPGFYDHIREIAGPLVDGFNGLFAKHGVPGRVQGLGARFGVYFGPTEEVRSYRDALKHDRAAWLRYIAAANHEGVYFHDYGGAACHHGFCAAMTAADVKEALARLDRAFARNATE
jgi:glutamate-1-semialdehyde 2,1-aminomutase